MGKTKLPQYLISCWLKRRCRKSPVIVLSIMLLLPGPVQGLAQGLSFASGRMSSYSAHALYAGYFTGQTLLFGGVLQNPRTAYREALVGVGRRMNGSHREIIVGLAVANTSAGDYVQLYLLPTARVGRAIASATVTAQLAWDPTGTRDLSVYPGTLHFLINDQLAVGTTWVMSATVTESVKQSVGPSATYRLAGATLGLHLLRNIAGLSNELWLTAWVTP